MATESAEEKTIMFKNEREASIRTEIPTGTKEPKEVPEQLDRLRSLLEDLDNSIVMLEEELKPVLRIDLKRQNNGDETKKEQQLVPLAGFLRERCRHAEDIIQHIGYLRQGLQI